MSIGGGGVTSGSSPCANPPSDTFSKILFRVSSVRLELTWSFRTARITVAANRKLFFIFTLAEYTSSDRICTSNPGYRTFATEPGSSWCALRNRFDACLGSTLGAEMRWPMLKKLLLIPLASAYAHFAGTPAQETNNIKWVPIRAHLVRKGLVDDTLKSGRRIRLAFLPVLLSCLTRNQFHIEFCDTSRNKE